MQESKKLNLTEDLILTKVLAYFEEDDAIDLSQKTENIISMFPFYQLLELNGLDHEIISDVAVILQYFGKSAMFTSNQSNLENSLNFLLSNLKFFVQDEDGTETLVELLSALHQILVSFHTVVNLKINLDVIYNLLEKIMISDHMNDLKVKQCLYKIFIATLHLHTDTQYEESLFKTCLTQLCIHIDENSEIAFEFINGLFRHQPHDIEYPPTVLRMLELNVGIINMETPFTTIKNCLESLLYIFKNDELTIMMNITKTAITKINVFCKFLQHSDNKEGCIEVLAKLINFAFTDTPWNMEELRIQLRYLSECKNWDIVDNEVLFIIYYIEFVHIHLQRDKLMMANKIEKTLEKEFSTHPLFLKAMCLLFPAYTPINSVKRQKINKVLLRDLEQYHSLEHLVTYHVSQLIWVICSNSSPLKIKVLQLWLKAEDYDNEIRFVVTKCKATPILLDMLFISSSSSREKIAELLRKIDNSNLKLDVMKSIPRTLHRHNTLYYILKAKPTVPQDPNQSMVIITQLINVLPKVQNVDALQEICSYCLKMATERKNWPKVILPLLSSYCVGALLEICSKAGKKLSHLALSLLRVTVIVQGKYKLNSAKSLEVDLNPIFERADLCIKDALLLLMAIINSKSDTPILKIVDPALAVYQTLLNNRNGEYGCNIYEALRCLLKQQQCLALSMHNIFCLEIECKKRDADKGFLLFLEAWLPHVIQHRYYRSPKESIRLYVNSLDVSKDKAVKELVPLITNLLNKWQTLPTTSTLYFSS